MDKILLTDVTLRDGLQMHSRVVPTESKLELLKALGKCQFHRIEVTSFVHPGKLPQFADAEKLCQEIVCFKQDQPLAGLMAFVPNLRGFERIAPYPMEWIACFVSVSEAFNERNVNATVAQSLEQVEKVVSAAKNQGRKTRVYISTVFGCPYQGQVMADAVKAVVEKVAVLAPDEIALGDTIGVATPKQVQEILGATSKLFPIERTALHLHNTYGLAIAAAQAGYQSGVRLFDAATGGVGGCPYAKGASGNVASEDLWYAFARQEKADVFPAPAFQAVLNCLAETLQVQPQGHLAGIWKQGGQWHGYPMGGV